MKTAIESSLLLSTAAGLAYLFLPNIRKWATYAFLAALTIFVAVSLTLAQQSVKEVPGTVLDLDQAELSLKMLSAFRITQRKQSASKLRTAISTMQYDGAPISQMLINKVYTQVILSLEKRLPPKQKILEHAPLETKDLRTLACIAIVCGDSGDASLHTKLVGATQVLSWSTNSGFRDLGTAISSIYSGKSISISDANRFEKILRNNSPSEWCRNQALMQLMQASGQTAAYEKLRASTDTASLAYARRTILLFMFVSFATFVGIITILIFLATEPRHIKVAETAAPWSLTTTYGVLVGWLATQLIAQSLIAGFAKQQVKQLLLAGSTTTAIATLVIYLITTGPALLFIWWFACRPFHLNLVDAVRLKLKTAVAGTPKLVSYGVLTWCAAIPLVLGSQLLALRLFSSHGSSNPMLSLVRDAAHFPSFMPVTIYFLVLGVVAPLMEESLFRGFVYSSLRTKVGKFIAAGISAAGFAAVHFDPGAFISLFALGFLFALVRERYQSILPTVVAHGMWNCGTFMLVLLLLGGE